MLTLKAATAIAGSLGKPSKMPGTSYGISAEACITGAKLAKVPGSTCFNCYALKANYRYPSVAAAHAKRLDGISNPAWTSAMVAKLTAAHATDKLGTGKGWHRWHDSGDLQSVEHLTKICAVAALTPAIRHWLPTRELGIVKAYVKAGGTVPANLAIRVSATMVDGDATQAWPLTSGVHTFEPHVSPLNEAAPLRICPAPLQGNACGPCRACWDFNVPHVSYHKH